MKACPECEDRPRKCRGCNKIYQMMADDFCPECLKKFDRELDKLSRL